MPLEQGKWGFRLSPAEANGSDTVTDGLSYDTGTVALECAKRFADRLGARERICSLLDDWLDIQKITTEDYVNLSQLLGEFFRL